MRILIKTELKKDINTIFAGFNLDLFKALKPPFLKLDVPRFDGCKKGDEVHLLIKFGPISQKWVSHITENGSSDIEHYFIDEGHVLPPPLKSWKHRHRIIKINDKLSVIHDDINYSCNNIFLDLAIFPAMYLQFWLRKPAYRKFFR